jgi:hypothetical protein
MSASAVKSFFTVHEVVVLTGFSKYMLDYLTRAEIFPPSGNDDARRGRQRRYLYVDVVLLRALHTICAGKGKIRHLKTSLDKFRTEFGVMRPGQRLDKCLFVQGNELCVYDGAEGGRQLRSGQITFGFFVDLAAVSQEIADCVIPGPSAREFALTVEVARAAEAARQEIWAPIKKARLEAGA